MLKRLKRCGAFFLAGMLLAAALVPASAEMAAQTGVDLARYYETMVYFFEQEMFDEARSCIDDHNLMGYEDTSAYVIYMDAVAAFEEVMGGLSSGQSAGQETVDGLEDVLDPFEGLANQGFKDSAAWGNYLAALIAEQSGDYEGAIEGYKAVILFRDSAERLTACRERLREVSQAQVEKLRREQYDDALRHAAEARANNDVAAMRSARILFENLGDYEDSAALAEECAAWIAAASRVLTLLAAPMSDSRIAVSLTDSNPGEGARYAASITALGCVHPSQTLQLEGPGVEISGLLPDTAYRIRVYDAENPAVGTEAEVTTYAPALWQDGDVKVVYRSLYAFRRVYLEIFDVEQIVGNYGILERQDSAQLNLLPAGIDEQEMAYLAMLTFGAGFEAMAGETHQTQCLLRIGDGGVYAAEPTETTFSGEAVIVLLEDLLGACYDDRGQWPTEGMTLQLYIDGALAGSMTLHMGTKQ